jgi:uncharacterized protein YqeY
LEKAFLRTIFQTNILRRAVIRRVRDFPLSLKISPTHQYLLTKVDAASKFTEASRLDLAEKENREAGLLSKFLPPLLSEIEIDRTLGEVIDTLPAGSDPRKSLGRVFKEFYSKVDKSAVDANVVKQRAEKLLTAAA